MSFKKAINQSIHRSFSWRHALIALLLCMSSLLWFSCGPGKAATGSMTVTLTVTRPDPVKVGDVTIKLSKAYLHIESVEVLGGKNVTQHSHDDGHNHDHGNGGSETGELKVTSSHALLNLLQDNTVLIDKASAAAGEYTLLALSLANAEEGATKGYALWLEGTAEKGTEKREFVVKWSTDKTLNDFAEFKTDIDLASGGSASATIAFDVAQLFAGVDLFAAQATGAQVTIDKDNNAAILETFAGNLKKVFSLK